MSAGFFPPRVGWKLFYTCYVGEGSANSNAVFLHDMNNNNKKKVSLKQYLENSWTTDLLSKLSKVWAPSGQLKPS